MNPENVTTAHIAIVISTLALAVSTFSLGWNVYKEIGLKARVKVGISVVEEVWNQGKSREKWIMIFAVNFGPGPVILTSLAVKRTWWNRKVAGGRDGSIIAESGPRWSSTFPIKLDVGQEARFSVPYNENSFLRFKSARVGVRDSFRREHWARRKLLRRVEADYRRDFEPKRSYDVFKFLR